MITNKLGLPEPIVKAVQAHHHKGAEYSASGLKKSVRQHWLYKRHGHEVTEDVADRIWALLGTATHYIVEQNDCEGWLKEDYLEAEYVNGIKLSGRFDLFDTVNGKVWDVKTVSVWQLKNLDAKEEWTLQANVYADLLERIGLPVKALSVCAIARDWSKLAAVREHDYPQAQVVEVPLELWPAEKRSKVINDRLLDFEQHRHTDDDSLPPCTPDEMWQKPTVWAVMKGDNKRAVKLHESEADALAHCESLGKSHHVVMRIGTRQRCEHYCGVNKWCHQYRLYRESMQEDEA